MNQDQSPNYYPGQNPQQGSANGYPYPNTGYPYPQGGSAQAPYSPQGGYPQPAQGGYGTPPAGYTQNPYYPPAPQAGYNPTGEIGAAPQQGYAPYPGAPAQGYDPGQGQGQGYPGGGYGNPQAGSYIPQTPNYTQGYNGPGYAPYPGYQAAQNPYGQMGREPEKAPNRTGQMPLNGGGYVPQPVPVRKKPFTLNNLHLIIGSAALILLFAAGMFIPGLGTLKWVFLVLAAACIALMWIRPLTEANKKICFTVVFGALCAVTVISFLGLGGGNADPQNPGKGGTAAVTQPGATDQPAAGQSGAAGSSVTSAPTSTPEPDNSSAVTNRLYQFFQYWSANQTDEMLTLCSPTWQSRTDNPKADLFGLLANRTPLDYNFENISGTNNDQSRTVTMNTLMDRNNGKDPSRYRLNVIMIKENEQWFVDPQSLQTYEAADTPDPNVTATPSPTPEMKAEPNTVLYYNPDGGTKYHLDQNCKSTHKKYLPMKGHFTYAEINKEPYVNLSPCNVCGAPLR